MCILHLRICTASIGMLLLMAARPIAGPQQQQAVDASHPPLVVTVSSRSGDSEHPIGRPLLLLVTISNPRAANVRNRNANAQRARENLAKSGELEKMTAAAREAFDRTSTAVPEPTANVGSATDPYWSLITFEFVHESGDKVTPAVRPLATTKEMPGEIRLEGRGGAWMAFGVDSHLQTAIRPGRYEVRATLRTTGRGNMWLGVATSEPLAVRLAAASGDSSAAAENARDYQEGRFHLLDKQFERAKRLGERLLARVP